MDFIQISDKSATQNQSEGLAFFFFLFFFLSIFKCTTKACIFLKANSDWSRLAAFQCLAYKGNLEIIFCLTLFSQIS